MRTRHIFILQNSTSVVHCGHVTYIVQNNEQWWANIIWNLLTHIFPEMDLNHLAKSQISILLQIFQNQIANFSNKI